MITYSLKIDITDTITSIGAITTGILLQKSLNGLSIDLIDQFCFVNEIKHNNNHYVIITATDLSLCEEFKYWFNKLVNTRTFELSAQHYDCYRLGA